MSCGAWLVRAVSINLAAVPPVPWLTQQSVTKHLMIKKNPEPKDKSYTVFQACLCCKIRLVNLKSTFAKSATSQQVSLCPGLELKLSGFPFEPEKTKFSGKHVMAWLLTHGFYCLLVALIIHVGFWFVFFPNRFELYRSGRSTQNASNGVSTSLHLFSQQLHHASCSTISSITPFSCPALCPACSG